MFDMGLGPYHGDFEALLEDEYEDMVMEADKEENEVVKVISDDDSEEVEDVDEDAGAQDVQIFLTSAEQTGMGQHGV